MLFLARSRRIGDDRACAFSRRVPHRLADLLALGGQLVEERLLVVEPPVEEEHAEDDRPSDEERSQGSDDPVGDLLHFRVPLEALHLLLSPLGSLARRLGLDRLVRPDVHAGPHGCSADQGAEGRCGRSRRRDARAQHDALLGRWLSVDDRRGERSRLCRRSHRRSESGRRLALGRGSCCGRRDRHGRARARTMRLRRIGGGVRVELAFERLLVLLEEGDHALRHLGGERIRVSIPPELFRPVDPPLEERLRQRCESSHAHGNRSQVDPIDLLCELRDLEGGLEQRLHFTGTSCDRLFLVVHLDVEDGGERPVVLPMLTLQPLGDRSGDIGDDQLLDLIEAVVLVRRGRGGRRRFDGLDRWLGTRGVADHGLPDLSSERSGGRHALGGRDRHRRFRVGEGRIRLRLGLGASRAGGRSGRDFGEPLVGQHARFCHGCIERFDARGRRIGRRRERRDSRLHLQRLRCCPVSRRPLVVRIDRLPFHRLPLLGPVVLLDHERNGRAFGRRCDGRRSGIDAE